MQKKIVIVKIKVRFCLMLFMISLNRRNTLLNTHYDGVSIVEVGFPGTPLALQLEPKFKAI